MAEAILAIDELVKNFGALRATDHVTLDLKPGEIHALIGPNGAGKTTLISQIAGTIRPDRGRISFEPRCRRAQRGTAGAARARAHVSGFVAGARILCAQKRHASCAVGVGFELPLFPAGDARPLADRAGDGGA